MDEFVICKACGQAFDTDRQLHAHLKAHDLRMVAYYQQYFPRHDLFDNSIIKFKNKEQYFSCDFNSRINLKNWLSKIPLESAKKYSKDVLSSRKTKKNLIYTPTQVELRSVLSPPIHYYQSVFGDYYKLCAELGFANKITRYPTQFKYGYAYQNPKYKIFIDTREQLPLSFNRETVVQTLKFGDYAFSDGKASCDAHVERKSIGDFIGTLSGGYERFCREIERAGEAKSNLIVLVEESLDNCLNFNSLPQVYKKNTRVTPEFVFYNVREIIQKYPYVQFLFVKNRTEAAETIEKIFTCGCAYKDIDLQLAYDLKLL